MPLPRRHSYMMFVRHTLKIADYALTALAVVFGLITLWMWAEAVMYWGDAYVLAEAFAFSVITMTTVAVGAGVEYLRNRGE